MAGEADALAAGLTGLSEGQREQAMTRWRLLAPHFEDGVPLARIAGQSGVGERTLQRWADRYRGRRDGRAGQSRSSCWDSIATSARLATMTFGKQSGPPASVRQVQELLALLREAGHTGFRDARGPMGFTQRQAGGKFTRDEAAAFIDRLQDAEFDASAPAAAPTARQSADEQALRHMPAEQLAAELRRRGWIATKP